jgi:hypothetical protein
MKGKRKNKHDVDGMEAKQSLRAGQVNVREFAAEYSCLLPPAACHLLVTDRTH